MSVFDDMVKFVKTANIAKDQIVCCMEGPAGIGKTAAVNQAARELAEEGKATGKVITIIASQILPNEVSGITMPVQESKSMEIFDHYRLASLEDGDILFFDELLEADQLVLSACLTLIESRQMMSGKQLPDIQIVAATNATIQPNMLKESIRQRFVWRRFDLDVYDCKQYIKKMYDLDITYELAKLVTCIGNEYNILTPRSLTKMAYWMSLANTKQEAMKISQEIDNVWKMGVGSELLKSWIARESKPEIQFREALRTTMLDNGISKTLLDNAEDGLGDVVFDNDTFAETSMTELIQVLSKLPEWDKIQEELSRMELQEDEVDNEVKF